MRLEVGELTLIPDAGLQLASQRFIDYIKTQAEQSTPTSAQGSLFYGVEQLILGIQAGNTRRKPGEKNTDHQDIFPLPKIDQLKQVHRGQRNSFELQVTQDLGQGPFIPFARTLIELIPETERNETLFLSFQQRNKVYNVLISLFASMKVPLQQPRAI